MAKGKYVAFRIEDDLFQKLDKLCRSAGVNISQYLRALIRKHVSPEGGK